MLTGRDRIRDGVPFDGLGQLVHAVVQHADSRLVRGIGPSGDLSQFRCELVPAALYQGDDRGLDQGIAFLVV